VPTRGMETDRNSAIPLLCYGGDHETRLAMTSRFWIALPMAFVLTVVQSVSPAHALRMLAR